MNETVDKKWHDEASPRGVVLAVLGMVTLGVAILSVAVSYDILEPKFGGWAVPTVGALDALWVVFQAAEMLAGNNRARARRVQYAGLVLTAVNAAIPTADLIMSRAEGFELAVILTPIAIVATKVAWWVALPSLGRKTSPATQQTIAEKRQQVADQLETMEAEAAHRIELLELAKELQQRVTKAETAYRKSVLKAQQTMTEDLHQQAEATTKTVKDKALPASVTAISLPELGTGWSPSAPALPVAAGRDASGPRMPALPGGRDASGTQPSGSHAGQADSARDRDGAGHADRDAERDAVTLRDLAAVAGVTTPEPGEQLTDAQLDVVLRHLRYREDPPQSYRQAVATFREAGFVGGEKRVRRSWGALLSKEETTTGAGRAEKAEQPEDAASEDESEESSDA
ncbi:hypothetical protein [Streptomyces chryseus]|uniref:hypothetical protein n=1 Tax=Streptomyces chryseus TaxID=68186 RepID=UPI0019B68438|nr:hypothetical protein [Streptomyces chryseus]GGX39929.1 hypothetical protein GCM10010353_64190 [Streptomyces chryseus]